MRNKQSAFSLIELVLSLALLSMTVTLAYTTLMTSSEAQQRLASISTQQQQAQTSFRLLSNAIASGATITGTARQLHVALNTSDHNRLPQHTSLTVWLNQNGQLMAASERHENASVLMENIERVEFAYFNHDRINKHWDEAAPPSLVGLTITQSGNRIAWVFERGAQ